MRRKCTNRGKSRVTLRVERKDSGRGANMKMEKEGKFSCPKYPSANTVS